MSKNHSIWNGECFVFDNRVSVQNELKEGTYELCYACRYPVSSEEKKSKFYKKGLSCPNCHDHLKPSQKERFRMRQRQINLAKERGKKHIFQKEF